MVFVDLSSEQLRKINAVITDRSNVFYWQTDRPITPSEAGTIWADRHRYFQDDEIIKKINSLWKDDQLTTLVPLDPEASTNLGNVNSVRVGKTQKKKDVVIRLHPRGIQNGYFFVEAEAAKAACLQGIASFVTYFVHMCEDEQDFAFHILEKLPGVAVQKWLEQHPEDEQALVYEMGKTMAGIHTISVSGFGPFLNTEAQHNKLCGVHTTEREAVLAGLPFNLTELVKESIITKEQAPKIQQLFETSSLLTCTHSVLVHNDMPDWNVLTDGVHITGVCDWDECVGGDPIGDIACWSTFFKPERLSQFLEGYFSVATKPDNFDEKFELLRFRYVLSKMTLRVRRYQWVQSDFLRDKIASGKLHLALSLQHFSFN